MGGLTGVMASRQLTLGRLFILTDAIRPVRDSGSLFHRLRSSLIFCNSGVKFNLNMSLEFVGI